MFTAASRAVAAYQGKEAAIPQLPRLGCPCVLQLTGRPTHLINQRQCLGVFAYCIQNGMLNSIIVYILQGSFKQFPTVAAPRSVTAAAASLGHHAGPHRIGCKLIAVWVAGVFLAGECVHTMQSAAVLCCAVMSPLTSLNTTKSPG